MPAWLADERSREWRIVLWALALANVAPLVVSAYVPISDLAEHAAVIATLRHWSDPAYGFAELYALDLGRTQYLGLYLGGVALDFLTGGAENALRAWLVLTGVALPLSLAFCLRRLRLDPRLALFSLPLFWSKPTLIGLFGYVGALPLVFFALGLLALEARAPRAREARAPRAREARAPSLRRQLALALIAIAVFYLHLSALLLLAGGALAVIGCVSHERAGAKLRRLAWLAPVGVLGLAWAVRSPVLDPGAVAFDVGLDVSFRTPLAALRGLPRALTNGWRGSADAMLLFDLCAAMALLALPCARAAAAEPDDTRRGRRAASWLLAFALLLYFAMPATLGWLWLLDERYAMVAAMLVPAALRPGPRAWQRWLPHALAAGIALATAGLIAAEFARFSREAEGFRELIERMPPRRRVLMLLYDERSETARFNPYHHFGAFYRARHGGVVEHAFVELPQSPLRYRPEAAPPRRRYGAEWFPREVEPGQTAYFDFLLVRGDPARVPVGPPGPTWRRVDAAGAWSVFARE